MRGDIHESHPARARRGVGVRRSGVTSMPGDTRQGGEPLAIAEQGYFCVGIRGNGHMMMLETNNLEIAAFLDGWTRKNVK